MSKPSSTSTDRAPDNAAVAWELAATARAHLTRADADRIYIAIGIGDAFEAIDALLTAIASARIPLGHDLIDTVASWLDCYRGQDAEPRLRRLLADVEASSQPRTSAFEHRFGRALTRPASEPPQTRKLG